MVASEEWAGRLVRFVARREAMADELFNCKCNSL